MGVTLEGGDAGGGDMSVEEQEMMRQLEQNTLVNTQRTAFISSKAMKSRDLRIDVLEEDLNQLELDVVEARGMMNQKAATKSKLGLQGFTPDLSTDKPMGLSSFNATAGGEISGKSGTFELRMT